MIKAPLSPEQLAYFQEVHYTQRIAQTKCETEKRWLQHQLDCILAGNDTRDIDRANRNLSIQFRNHQKQLA